MLLTTNKKQLSSNDKSEGTQMAKIYKNIPVSPATYQKVALLAEANGLGGRGLGAQIEKWVERELPDCGHKKQSVSIEIYTSEDTPRQVRTGWYCPTCKRVYEAL
jgi:hypothetical protein